MALALRAAGWWLRRGGRLLAALGVGLTTVLAARAGGPPVVTGLELAGAAVDLLALEDILAGRPLPSPAR